MGDTAKRQAGNWKTKALAELELALQDGELKGVLYSDLAEHLLEIVLRNQPKGGYSEQRDIGRQD